MSSPTLSGLLYKFLDVSEPRRTSDEYLHISDIYDSCMRQLFLAKKEKIELTRKVPPATRMKFEMGKAVETILKGWFKQLGVYHEIEPKLRHEDLKIQGTPDFRLKNNMLAEIKAMAPPLFRISSRKPLPHHKFQVQAYLWLDNAEKIALLFSATWGEEKMPFRDTLIPYNLKVGEAIKKIVGLLREAEAGGVLPPRVCATQDMKRALLCPLRNQCFQLPSVGTILTAGELAK